YRARTSDNPVERLLSPFTEVFDALKSSPIIGTGMASTNAAAVSIMGTAEFWWLNGNDVEAETARVLQETGLIGFVLVFAARLWLLIIAIRLGVRFKTP